MKKPKTSSSTVVSVSLFIHHPLALRYIRDLLQKEDDFHILINTRQPISNSPAPPRVAIVDSEALPSVFARYVANLRVQLPDSRFLVLGHELSDIEICQLLLLGIHGFIAYDRLEKDLVSGVRKLWNNHLMVPPRVLEQFAQYASSMKRQTNDSPFKFSARQRVALDLLQQGLSNKEIATAMQVSTRTVKFHLSNIFSKIGVHDRHSLADMLRAAATPPTMVNEQRNSDTAVDGMLSIGNKVVSSPDPRSKKLLSKQAS